LVLVAAAPLLALGGSARAGYCAPVALIALRPAASFADGGGGGQDCGAAPDAMSADPDAKGDGGSSLTLTGGNAQVAAPAPSTAGLALTGGRCSD
jgi:hypothetical protein